MRLFVGLAALILLFVVLVRLLPAQWALPLYVFFVLLTVAFTGWERRRIARRRRQLQRQLDNERQQFSERREKLQRDRDGK